jgi:tyrosine-protein kinase Etk/Wzc
MNANYMSDDDQSSDFNLREAIERNLSHWRWYLLGAFISLCCACFYLRYTTPQYKAATTILVKDDKKGGMLSELSAFSDMGLGSAMKSNVDNEVEILKSRTLVENTVKDLELNISIFEKSRIRTVDVYKNATIDVRFVNPKKELYESKMHWEFVQLSAQTFKLLDAVEPNEVKPKGLLTKKKVFRFGELIPTIAGDLVISKSKKSANLDSHEGKSIFIKISPLDAIVGSYLGRIKVDAISKTSSVVGISFTDSNHKRSEIFLNKMIRIYNDAAAADKNFISENTSRFIDERLVLISEELNGVEKNVQSFKQFNSLTDVKSEAQMFIEGINEYDKKSVENEIELNVVTSLIEFLKKSTTADLLPSNVVSDNGEASELISSYNQLVLQRNRIFKSATVVNPYVVALDQQILSLKSNITESLRRLQSSLNIQKRNLSKQEGLLDFKIGKIPVQERKFRVIERQQKVKEELYLYLLEKREETAISLAATAPNSRVIDSAKASTNPVFPKSNTIYLAALLLGLLIPFGIIYVIDLLDTKVKTRFDITDRFNIPFLGDVPHSKTPYEVTQTNNRSSSAEAMRIIRANLDFMLNQVPEGKSKNIFLTSTIPSEGKTYLSVNLASIFANSGKKVLLIGMDIRKPRLNSYLGVTETKGLTDYLSTKDALIEDYIIKYKGVANLDVLLAGSIPPNPSELLMNIKIDELFAKFKKEYDFVVVDTAPVSLVSDTLIIAKHADTFVYVVRANHLDKRLLSIPEVMHRENKLPNIGLLLNDTVPAKGYGFNYGYGYGDDHETIAKPWYKKLLKK